MISLIVTVYNKAPFLERCLESVRNQYDKSAQIIIVDDGSTDGSEKICDYYEKVGFEVYHTENRGVSAARNYGMRKAQGDYITFLDADDALTPDALAIMRKYAEFGKNIVQFNHFRFINGPDSLPVQNVVSEGDRTLKSTPKYWPMVWNKIYKKDFLKKHCIKFAEEMNFGEDEMFNVECILRNGGIYCAFPTIYNHYFDDKNSICRGSLNLDKIKELDAALKKRLLAEENDENVNWLWRVINRHHRSVTFRKFGFRDESRGDYDIVYFVKDEPRNEELRYSLRSVEENWKYRDVWFYGGCPEGLKPDKHISVEQNGSTKFENVREMMRQVCMNDEITEDFWLFNDDFFILKPMPKNYQPQYNGTLYERIVNIENRQGLMATAYTKELRKLATELKKAKLGCLNYAVHKPMLINRKKMLEVLNRFPGQPMIRALYGNYYKIGGEDKHDMKVEMLDFGKMDMVAGKWNFLSTSDESFERGTAGRFIREKFKNRSRFEV